MAHDILDDPIASDKPFDRSALWESHWRKFNIWVSVIVGAWTVYNLVSSMNVVTLTAWNGLMLMLGGVFFLSVLNVGYVLTYLLDIVLFKRSRRYVSYGLFWLYLVFCVAATACMPMLNQMFEDMLRFG